VENGMMRHGDPSSWFIRHDLSGALKKGEALTEVTVLK